jgi:hypothetical protein
VIVKSSSAPRLKYQKAWWKSKTLWLAFLTGALGAALEAFDSSAPGWFLGVLSVGQMVLRALTDKPLSVGEVDYDGPLEG